MNWLRYCLETKCSGDEAVRKREYPSRPGEAFESQSGAVLDMAVLARWWKEAESSVPSRGSMDMDIHPTKPPTVSFQGNDRMGKIEVFEPPRYGHRYVMGLDSSNGVGGGDWTVACVLDTDSGVQVAEYRAIIDPDLAVEQVEALAIWYNKAYTVVETNGGYGMPYLRHLLDRNTVPMYERMAFDKLTRELTKRPGFDTNTKTRPILVAAMREAVRKEHIHLKSKTTISECRTLHEKRSGDVGSGKIEARPGCHDDGFFAAGLALMGRNKLLGNQKAKDEDERKKKPMMKRFDRMAKLRDRALNVGSFPAQHVHPGGTVPEDGSRSRL